MTASVTKANTLVLSSGGGETRITKAVTLVLASVAQPVYLTKSITLILCGPDICSTKLCQCWKITRRDNISFAYTTHNEKVTFMGVEYKPCSSLSATAFESGLLNSNEGGDVEINGILSDGNITEHDLAHGLFDGATVEVYLVSWDSDTLSGTKRIGKGIIGDTTQGGSGYKAQVLTISAKLSQTPLIDVFSPSCRYTLGQGLCPVNLTSYQYSGTVTAVLPRSSLSRVRNRQFFDSGITQSNGYYSLGKILWLTGANAGITAEVKDYFSANDLISLWEPMPFEIQNGDTYIMTPGCNKSFDDHTVKFSLTADTYGGQPDLPGNDYLMRTPDAR